jgi:hypothetical protein
LENNEGSAKKLFTEYPPGVFIDFPDILIPLVDVSLDELDEDEDEDSDLDFDSSAIFFNKFAKHAVGHPQPDLLEPLLELDPFDELDELDEPSLFDFELPGAFNPEEPDPFPLFEFIKS